MAFINIFNFEDSSGLLKKEYEKGMRKSRSYLEDINNSISNTGNFAGFNEIIWILLCMEILK
jgi:hypothetical protein